MDTRRASLVAAAAVLTAGVAVACPSVALADSGETWRDGWCAEGEGTSVVVDWHLYADAPLQTPLLSPNEGIALVRCVPVTDSLPGVDQFSLLRLAGISYDAPSSLFHSINGIGSSEGPVASGVSWHLRDGTAGVWGTAPVPGSGVDQFFSYTLKTGGEDPYPAAVPQFGVAPGPTTTPTPDATGEPGPSGEPEPTGGPESSGEPEPSSEPEPTGEPTQELEPSSSPQPSDSPTPMVSTPESAPPPSPSPTATATPTGTRTPIPTPSVTASSSPSQTSSAPEETAATAAATPTRTGSPTPTPTPDQVWAEETAQRSGTQQQAAVALPGWGGRLVAVLAVSATAGAAVWVRRGRARDATGLEHLEDL